MNLAELSGRHGNFYAPAFRITVDGNDIIQALGIGISSVEVDRSLGALGRFSFTAVGTYSLRDRAFLRRGTNQVLDVLRFGARVSIALGYGDQSRLTPLLEGVITSITTQFPEGGTPELTISGYDHAFSMTLGKETRAWTESSDSAVVSKMASLHKLNGDIQSTHENHAQVEQNQESDFEFACKLAKRNGFEIYVTPPNTLRFAQPRDRDSDIVILNWGEGLLSFQPEANLAAQVSMVEVVGWDPDKGKAIIGKAVAGEESGKDADRKSAGERLREALGETCVLRVRQPVFTEAEAKRRAVAILSDHAKKFLTGQAEAIGLPELMPDSNVALGNLGDMFSKVYYIEQAVHKLDSNGYRTRFKIKETSA